MAPNCFPQLAHAAFRWLFIGPAPFHLTERTLALHFFLQNAQRGIDVVVADKDLNRGAALTSSCSL